MPKKRKVAELPSVEMEQINVTANIPTTETPIADIESAVESSSVFEEPAPEEPVDEMPIESVSVEIPVAKLRTGYTTRRIDVAKMTGKQAEGVRKVVNGLIAQKAKLLDGRMVQRPQDAVKWIFEQV